MIFTAASPAERILIIIYTHRKNIDENLIKKEKHFFESFLGTIVFFLLLLLLLLYAIQYIKNKVGGFVDLFVRDFIGVIF